MNPDNLLGFLFVATSSTASTTPSLGRSLQNNAAFHKTCAAKINLNN